MKGKDMHFVMLLDFYGAMLTDRQLEVMEFYYQEDMSLSEIAQHTDITRQGVRDLIKRAEASLLGLEERLGFVAKFDGVCRDVSQIKALAAQVGTICESRNCGAFVKAPLSKIGELAENMLE